MTEALGREVYHYHLHVVYVPVVEKQILWSKRCKDKALVGTVKETVMQVSRSKKWASKPLLDDAGKPVLQKNGKPVLKKSYSVLQDDFFNYHTQRKRKIRTLLQSETGSDFSCLVGAGGFEPPKLKAADLQSVPIGHSGTRPYSFVAHPFAGRLVYFSMRKGFCQPPFFTFFQQAFCVLPAALYLVESRPVLC